MFAAKWLICIFSYNRGTLLLNLIESARAFYPEFDIVIFDDSSDDHTTSEILDTLELEGLKIISSNKHADESKHGGLYSQMNKALHYAIERGFDYAYFVQDDMQFLWRDEKLEIHTSEAFEHEECVMCNYNFLQKILIDGIVQRLPLKKNTIYAFAGNGVADTGVIDIRKAKTIGLYFPEHSERGNGQYWHKKGYQLYWFATCHLAWVPWPTTFRHAVKENRKSKKILPLGTEAIERIKNNTTYAYLEDYTSLKGALLKPYWYTSNPGWINLLKIYMKYYLKSIF